MPTWLRRILCEITLPCNDGGTVTRFNAISGCLCQHNKSLTYNTYNIHNIISIDPVKPLTSDVKPETTALT